MKQSVGTRGQTLKYVVPVFIGFSLDRVFGAEKPEAEAPAEGAEEK